MTTHTKSAEIHLDGGDISVFDFPLPAIAHFDCFWQYTLCHVMWVLTGESRKLAMYKHMWIRVAIRMSWWITVANVNESKGQLIKEESLSMVVKED